MVVIAIDKGVIKGVFAGDLEKIKEINPGCSVVEAGDDCHAVSGTPTSWYLPDWKRKPLGQLVQEGLVQVPEGYIVEGEQFVPSEVPATITLEQKKIAGQNSAEQWLVNRRKSGFVWNNILCHGDPEAQSNYAGYKTLIDIGVPGPFLLHSTDNVDHMIPKEHIPSLLMTTAVFVQWAYSVVWNTKKVIREATSESEIVEALELMDTIALPEPFPVPEIPVDGNAEA